MKKFKSFLLSILFIPALLQPSISEKELPKMTALKHVKTSQSQNTRITSNIEMVLSEYQIPGAAVGIIKDGEVTLNAGFGVLKRNRLQKVNPYSLFQVASLSKAFTAEVVTQLAKEGVLNLDVPVKEYLDDFELFDKEAESQLTTRDLLCQRSGLPTIAKNSWRFWYNRGLKEKDFYKLLKYIEPQVPSKKIMTYNNMNFLIVDMVVRKKTNKSIQEHVQERILRPLEMSRTCASHRKFMRDKNKSFPHYHPDTLEGTHSYYDTTELFAAMGLSSCSSDMLQWIQYLLNKEVETEEMFQPHVDFNMEVFNENSSEFCDEFVFRGDKNPKYGLGWMIFQVNGKAVYMHTGLCEGFFSYVVLIPETKSGFFMSMNQEDKVPAVLFNTLFDEILDIDEIDWILKYDQFIQKAEEREKKIREEFFKEYEDASLALVSLEQYVGVYTNKAYGSIKIFVEDGELKAAFPSKEIGTFVPLQEGEFQIKNVYANGKIFPWVAKFETKDNRKKLIIEDYCVFFKDRS